MMKTRGLVFASLILAVSLALVMPILGSQEQEHFIIEGADAVATRAAGTAFTSPIPLEPRFILEWADAMTEAEVAEVPPELPQPGQPRFILEWADAMASREAEPVPEGMLHPLQTRFILEWADTSRGIHIEYPCELVGDEAAPLISLSDPQVQGDSATIRWQTDELADSMLEYGLAPGSYTETVDDPEYSRSHVFTITGLLPDTLYYCRVTSTDRCGNTASTSDCQWIIPTSSYVYLPLVLRSH